jgi:hypothetical protein
VDEFIRRVGSHRTFSRMTFETRNVTEENASKLDKWLTALHSDRSKLIQMMVSVKYLNRIGKNSSLRLLPVEIFRSLMHYFEQE